uniref:Uncharacterized protein n=1 Tax=Seriola lalandi dorsalis TaxID=1841481 RepID=A0A3B4YXK4_SERLL
MGGRGGGGGNATLAPSFTTLSTIAIQAGQSQIVVSVLRSGLLVHLQLVQFHPGLCEIGLNQEENQRLIQEQQQLLEKLKVQTRKHVQSITGFDGFDYLYLLAHCYTLYANANAC